MRNPKCCQRSNNSCLKIKRMPIKDRSALAHMPHLGARVQLPKARHLAVCILALVTDGRDGVSQCDRSDGRVVDCRERLSSRCLQGHKC